MPEEPKFEFSPDLVRMRLPIPVVAEALVWMSVVSNIQLALRHPKNVGPSVPMVREFAHAIVGKLLEEKVLTQAEAQVVFEELFYT